MEFKKLIIILSIAATVIVVCLLGVSYAYYSLSNASTEFNTTVANDDVYVVYAQSEYISTTTGIPISEDEIAAKASSSKFTALADSTTFAGYEVALEVAITDIFLDTALQDSYFKIQLLENGSVVKTVTGADIGTNSKVVLKNLSIIEVGTTYNYEVRVWIQDSGVSQNAMMGKNFSGRIQISSSMKK